MIYMDMGSYVKVFKIYFRTKCPTRTLCGHVFWRKSTFSLFRHSTIIHYKLQIHKRTIFTEIKIHIEMYLSSLRSKFIAIFFISMRIKLIYNTNFSKQMTLIQSFIPIRFYIVCFRQLLSAFMHLTLHCSQRSLVHELVLCIVQNISTVQVGWFAAWLVAWWL